LGQIADSTKPHDGIHRDDNNPQKNLHPSFGDDAHQSKCEGSLAEDAANDDNHEADV
jgi:hypothetical protein